VQFINASSGAGYFGLSFPDMITIFQTLPRIASTALTLTPITNRGILAVKSIAQEHIEKVQRNTDKI
jgi:hypothetical protein